ncbi:MAG: cobalt-precorrin hydrolase / cobalt-factor methyltransferase / precorrin-3B [Acidimicrobiaceae bacterium]|jgi:cobalt-precorrin 5A hydrolase/precorrin-3B C17-methyltransferase|nr:cobalt-precorrin hydrolase / cobalt-factor methyltransferase / precorrin-3B [Acidimicrobiaceae bacterium]
MSPVSVSITEAGRRLAEQLPFEHVHGSMGPAVRERWGQGDVDGFVLFAAIGAAVRIVAPLLDDKRSDPAVVCVDEAGRFAVALCGGHHGGANDLARQVGALLGATPVVTTATDATGLVALDMLPDLVASGDVAGVSAALLDGRLPIVDNPRNWPLPEAFPSSGPGPERILVTDAVASGSGPGTVLLRPASLVVGVGSSTVAESEEVVALVTATLAEAGLSADSVHTVATIERRRHHPAVTGLGLPVTAFSAEALAAVPVPNPSDAARQAVGTASVCEAAALLGAGEGGALVVEKRTSKNATVAIARRRHPIGRVVLVGLGPGGIMHRTPAAEQAVRRADVVIGYGAYVDQCQDLLATHHQVIRSNLGSEMDRARQALSLASAGKRVAMVCSGDAGVYAMASPVLELADQSNFANVIVDVVPGVTAGLAASARLGAPLGHDHVLISLSDLLTPWDRIEARLRAAADSDLVVVLYNPRSERRTWQLGKALGILGGGRPPTTPVGIVTDAGRPGERVAVTTLEELDPTAVTMTTCVIVGSSTTVVRNDRMVTPRGYPR